MTVLSILLTVITTASFVIFIDAYMFLNENKKYRGYVSVKHYIETLKMPMYQQILMRSILKAVIFVTVFQLCIIFTKIIHS